MHIYVMKLYDDSEFSMSANVGDQNKHIFHFYIFFSTQWVTHDFDGSSVSSLLTQ